MATKKVTTEETMSKLEEAKSRMEKLYGKGSIMTLGDKKRGEYEVISTGSIGMDYIVLGIGGVALSKMYEIRGWEGTGKSTICANLMANCQKTYKRGVLCIDAEHAADISYYKKLGINTDELMFNQCSYGEEGFTVADEMIKTGDIALCIIDSDSGLIPKKVMQGLVEETSKLGVKASLNSTMYPKLKVSASQNNCAVVVVSQYREKPGAYGDPKVTQGGHCLKFTADVIMEVSKSLIKTADGEEKPGNETKVKTIKNKLFPPFREWKFDILFGQGIDTFKETLSLAEELKVLERAGAYYKWSGESIAQGWDKLVQFMRDNEELYETVKTKTIATIKGGEIIEQAIPETK